MIKFTTKHLPSPDHPGGPVHPTTDHEYLTQPVKRKDPILQSWITHLRQKKVPYSLLSNGNGHFQIYLHVIKHFSGSGKESVWCCSESQRRKDRVSLYGE